MNLHAIVARPHHDGILVAFASKCSSVCDFPEAVAASALSSASAKLGSMLGATSCGSGGASTMSCRFGSRAASTLRAICEEAAPRRQRTRLAPAVAIVEDTLNEPVANLHGSIQPLSMKPARAWKPRLRLPLDAPQLRRHQLQPRISSSSSHRRQRFERAVDTNQRDLGRAPAPRPSWIRCLGRWRCRRGARDRALQESAHETRQRPRAVSARRARRRISKG